MTKSDGDKTPDNKTTDNPEAYQVDSRTVPGTVEDRTRYTADTSSSDNPDPPEEDSIHKQISDLVERHLTEADRRSKESEPPEQIFTDTIPARMLNEYVYCQRLFYYEFVEGVFLHNAHTRRGTSAHSRVDRAKGGTLPTRQAGRNRGKANAKEEGDSTEPPEEDKPEVIHSRSVSLGSKKLGVSAKLDLVEVRETEDDLLSDYIVCPVEYKVGSPKQDNDGLPTLWDTDKIQLGLQILLLRENGYSCDEGIVFYRGTRQRVRLPMTPDLAEWIGHTIVEARRVAAAPAIPAPLIDSPKCVGCSLSPVCLPDETRHLIEGPQEETSESRLIEAKSQEKQVRRLIAKKDVKRVVYLTTPGLQIGFSKGGILRCSEKGKVVDELPVNDVLHLGLFGNVGITTPAIRELINREIPISWFSTGGWFYGMARGHGLTNVMTRIEQFAAAREADTCLDLARKFIRGKIRNSRVMLMRNHVEPPAAAIKRLKHAADNDVPAAASLAELLGIEGAAARVYFQHFAGTLKPGDDDIEKEDSATESPNSAFPMTFDFNGRNRRPPADPVNALLSLAYSLLAKDCTVAALAVGFDPYVGFYHQPRHGRPALALDVMEEFRPLVADSAVLQAVNNRIVTPVDFVRAGSAVNLTPAGRKRFLQTWERRIITTITHPVFGYQVSYRRAIELQFRMLARVLTGEIETYTPFMTR